MSVSTGLIACGVSSVLFGSMFVPIRRFDTGDGIFVQWVISSAILMVGFVVFAVRGFPGFFPLGMVGGVAWTVGNVTAIPIFNRLGMALGILIWSVVSCVTGWASGRFGLFGMKASVPSSPILNYIGLACVVTGGLLYSRIKPSSRLEEEYTLVDTIRPRQPISEKQKERVDDIRQGRRIVGFILSILAGLLYGMTFVPVSYMIDHPDIFPDHPTRFIDYVFSHYVGIYVTASLIFLAYSMIKKNEPLINPNLALPAYFSGLIFGIAQAFFFVATENLSQTVTFPIIVMLPGSIASLWSIFYFKEITGNRNYFILTTAMCITLVGVTLVGISKEFELPFSQSA